MHLQRCPLVGVECPIRRRCHERLNALRDATHRLWQAEQGDVHQVVAVEVGVEDQVRQVTGMLNEGPDICEQVRVAGRAGATVSQGGPLGGNGRRLDMSAIASAEPCWIERQGLAMERGGVGEPSKRGVDRFGRAPRPCRIPFGPCRGVARQAVQRGHQRPLERCAAGLGLCEAHISLNSGDQQPELRRQGEREREGDEREAGRDPGATDEVA